MLRLGGGKEVVKTIQRQQVVFCRMFEFKLIFQLFFNYLFSVRSEGFGVVMSEGMRRYKIVCVGHRGGGKDRERL